jgi:limonene-1,2-epoxide hydrolase
MLGASTKEHPMPKAPLDVVNAFMKAMETNDYDAALPHIAESCEYTNIPMNTVTGPAGVRAVLEPFFAPVKRNEFITLRHAVAGDVVFLERLDRHHFPDGRVVELPVTGVFEVKDGKITVWRDYFDLQMIMSKWPAA